MTPATKKNTPSFDKSPEELVAFFHTIMANFPQAEIKKTFGYPCAYLNGHMTTGLHTDAMFLRLSEVDEAEFLKLVGAKSFAPMQNRPMRGYVVVPESLRRAPKKLMSWIEKALSNSANLPPKAKKTKSKNK